jgi:hypothetical protein
MSAATIADVLARLDVILEQSLAAGDRRGFFAAVYKRVTLAVRDGIAAGDFEDGPRMERLDVVFANRYLDAYDAYARGERPTRAWQRTFDAARDDDVLVLQHLLLAMNTHITLDLGIAVLDVAPGAAMPSLERDFDRINGILATLVGTVEDELTSIVGRWEAPVGALLALLEADAHGADRSVAMLIMRQARASAWRFATGLSALSVVDKAALEARISVQDEETSRVCAALLVGAPVVELALRLGHRDVAASIRALASGELPVA